MSIHIQVQREVSKSVEEPIPVCRFQLVSSEGCLLIDSAAVLSFNYELKGSVSAFDNITDTLTGDLSHHCSTNQFNVDF